MRTLQVSKEIPVRYEPDLLVIGGGLTGIMTAIAAAKSGVDVLLLERSAKLGGNFSGGMIGTFCGYYCYDHGDYYQCVGGLGGTLLQRLHDRGAIGEGVKVQRERSVPYDVSTLEHVLDQMILEQKNIQVLFHQYAFDVITEGRRVQSVIVTGKQGEYAIQPKMIVDCSGDGDIAYLAGVPVLTDGGNVQFPATTFHLGGVDYEKAFSLSGAEITEITKKAVEEGRYKAARVDGTRLPLPRPGEIRCNIGRLRIGDRPINPLNIEEVSFGEFEGRGQAFEYLNFLQENIPGYENAYIVRMADSAGIRESRRFKGKYVLTEEDVMNATKFSDGILCSSWPVEQHKAGSSTHWQFLPDGECCEVPLRCLIPEELDNLFFAGRILSAQQVAQAAVRSGPPCMGMGEAVGITAAMAIKEGYANGDVDPAKVRAELRSRGAYLPEHT